MNNYIIRKKIVSNSITILTSIIFVFLISHILFGERSVWKIINNKKNIMTEINLLRDNNLDSDYITEISYDLLGLIQSDQIVIDIK